MIEHRGNSVRWICDDCNAVYVLTPQDNTEHVGSRFSGPRRFRGFFDSECAPVLRDDHGPALMDAMRICARRHKCGERHG